MRHGNGNGQVNLYGEILANEKNVNEEGRKDMFVWMSVLQKAVRRSLTTKAMYAALKLCETNWYMVWKRLSVIADEDVGQPEAIVAVDVLFKKFLGFRKQGKEGEVSWDMKRCVVCAAKILAESPKDRRADEFLELIDAVRKNKDDADLRKVESDLERVPDFALDMHTVQGRKLGRGNLFWFEVSSETVDKTSAYEEWRDWFKPLMIELVKEKRGE